MLSREYNPCSWLLLLVVRSLPQMCFLNSSSVLADLSFIDSFPHSNCLGHKYCIERLPYITYRVMPRSGKIRLPQEP